MKIVGVYEKRNHTLIDTSPYETVLLASGTAVP